MRTKLVERIRRALEIIDISSNNVQEEISLIHECLDDVYLTLPNVDLF